MAMRNIWWNMSIDLFSYDNVNFLKTEIGIKRHNWNLEFYQKFINEKTYMYMYTGTIF